MTVTEADSHYGACVDTVDGESDSTNNCTPMATETVAGFELDSENADPGGIAHADGLLYLGQWLFADTIHAYSLSGERRSDKDFDLDSENTSVFGMDHDGTTFYMVDDEALRVFVYKGDEVAGSSKAGSGSDQPVTNQSRTTDGNIAHRADRRMDEEDRRRNLQKPSRRQFSR